MNAEPNYSDKLKQTIQLLDKVFARYTQNEIFISFNGGKDCTVLLDIVMARFQKVKQEDCNVRCIYIQPSKPFEEIDVFVEKCMHHYGINIQVIKGTVKSVLHQLCKETPNIKACLMGTRNTDPHCENLQSMQVHIDR
ncbi:FAD synthase-like isoform X2 [Sabethes cyaneus]|uniref:FAD synthase-like isoform X2 n=1 Tax=Sabethes cyaneus TaxID=53552 RepID=UPI00237EDD27|nr:FAD synthase-like isoform X2 [Sabethes cyaneus]